jgi:hypothetical protein
LCLGRQGQCRYDRSGGKFQLHVISFKEMGRA